MVTEIEGNFDTSAVHPWVKYGLAILLIIILFDSIISGNYFIGIVPLGIAWFFAGPQCVKWAQQGKHNQTWAFFIGVLFNLVGVFAYWLYIKRLSYPIMGGIAAMLLSVFALIFITVLKFPIILPFLQSYSDQYGIVGSLMWFLIWFIAGFIILYHRKNSKKNNKSSKINETR